MEYRRSEYVGDNSIDEVYEGTPEEIAELVAFLRESEEGLIYNQDDAIGFILSRMGDNVYPELVKTILEAEEDYMRSVGIID